MKTPSFPGDVELAGGVLCLVALGGFAKLINGYVEAWQLWGFFVLGAALVIFWKKLRRNQ